MLFKPELAVKIISGEKTQTRRWTPNMPVKVGNTFFAQLKLFDKGSRFAQLQAVNVYEWNPLHITKAIAKAEGFDAASEFSKVYQSLNAHKSLKTKSGKTRINWAVEFKVVNLLYNPTLPDVIQAAMRKQWQWCGCGDAFFSVNTDTSEKSCNTCAMLDKMQIDADLEQIGELTKKGTHFNDTDSKTVVGLRDRIIEKIHENYDVEIKPFQIITQAFVDGLFVCQQER